MVFARGITFEYTFVRGEDLLMNLTVSSFLYTETSMWPCACMTVLVSSSICLSLGLKKEYFLEKESDSGPAGGGLGRRGRSRLGALEDLCAFRSPTPPVQDIERTPPPLILCPPVRDVLKMDLYRFPRFFFVRDCKINLELFKIFSYFSHAKLISFDNSLFLPLSEVFPIWADLIRIHTQNFSAEMAVLEPFFLIKFWPDLSLTKFWADSEWSPYLEIVNTKYCGNFSKKGNI